MYIRNRRIYKLFIMFTELGKVVYNKVMVAMVTRIERQNGVKINSSILITVD
jgi:hypothetical protein